MSDYYCSMERLPELGETRITAPLGIEAAEKYAHMMWQEGEIPDRDKCDEVIIVRFPDSVKAPSKFRVVTQTTTVFVARDIR